MGIAYTAKGNQIVPVTRRLVIRGRKVRDGRVRISGAKNSAVALLPATLLADGESVLQNVPDIADVAVQQDILRELGATVTRTNAGEVRVEASGALSHEVPYPLAKRLRGSVLLLGPLVARLGRARVPLPGGCAIGSRPLDLHLKGLRELGAEVEIEHGYICAQAKSLLGTEIYLDFPSVGATENVMMAATAARGVTVIYNAAKEPEVVDLANFINAMGGRVIGAGTDTIKIEGGHPLRAVEYSIIPDRIEAGTYLLAGLAGGGSVTVENVIPTHLEALLAKLEEAGVELADCGDAITARLVGRPKPLQVKTLPYPGFPTDLQPQLTAFLLLSEGTSVISERIFEDRFGHVDELKRLGGKLETDGRTAVIKGVERLTGSHVTATDLRMGAALIVAGIAAEGETVIDGVEHIQRGYERLTEKLTDLGVVADWID
ncbi:MAG: UDP-N-acetylglucosamine 1-carboxyvinyltransferase [Bacillota bacterium]|nr:UDP-N-acetylglucosamine 1-carboxyvinyltransferase [Bacillota bacterium]REJ37419.1 MAG: UDP-N-acetylglucosamine 1-carboxyvinyltransferase [Bacillota bacterium]